MSRFTISILLATALLGVLLWIVISIATDLANAPEQPMPLPEEPAVELDPYLPRIANEAEFRTWITGLGYAADPLIYTQAFWSATRGLAVNRLLRDTAGQEDDRATDDVDDAELLMYAGQGDLRAMHLLADRSLMRDKDPLEALEWYDRAIVNGSLHAMLAVADLLVILTDPALAEFQAEPEWQAAVEQLKNAEPPPQESALAWTLAAVIVGGYGILDRGLAQRIEVLSEGLDIAGLERACTTAQDYVLDAATARRAQGGAVFTTEQPALAITYPEPESVIPCDTPMEPLVSLRGCAHHDFVAPDGTLASAWFCTH